MTPLEEVKRCLTVRRNEINDITRMAFCETLRCHFASPNIKFIIVELQYTSVSGIARISIYDNFYTAVEFDIPEILNIFKKYDPDPISKYVKFKYLSNFESIKDYSLM